MPHRQTALVSPRLGIYFGILAACLAGGVLVLLVLEQLGVREATLKGAMAVITVALFAVTGAAGYTGKLKDFLSSGRRVPAIYNGISMAVATPGGAGLAGLAGAMFLIGFDVLCIGVGLVAGLAVSVMTIAPYIRKFGAPTVPGYVGLRFDSQPARLMAASISVVPLMLLAIAEIKIATMAATWLVPVQPGTAALAIAAVLVITNAPGGARSVSWSAAAQSMAVLVAILLPAAIAAVMETNLPFGQLSHGPLVRAVGRMEAGLEVPIPVAGLLALDLPGAGLQPLAGRYQTVFGSIGALAFVMTMLTVVVGVAGSPALLSRAVTTPSVFETRKSIGWAVVIVGVLIMTFSSLAVFQRDLLLTSLSGQTGNVVPAVLQRLVDTGLAGIDGPGRLRATSVWFDRDGTLLALPILLGLPSALVNLVAAGVLAAALAGAALSVTQLGIIIGEDVANTPAFWRTSDFHRISACRIAVVAATALATVGAIAASGDPFMLLLYSFAISGSTLFPVLALSIWWKRMTAIGAIAGLGCGFVVALAVVALGAFGGIGLPPLLAAMVALPVAVAAVVVATHLTPGPSRHILEVVRELRIPGGETLYDRAERQARHRGQQGR